MRDLSGLVTLAVVGLVVLGCAGSSGEKMGSAPAADSPETAAAVESPIEVSAPVAEAEPVAETEPPAESVPIQAGPPASGFSQAGAEIQSKVVALDFGKVDVRPRVVHAEPPAYPRTAREAKVEGTVVVGIEIDTEGRPQKVTVRRSVLMLDEAAVQAAREWRFTPAFRDGKPIPVKIEVPFDFKLR